jgi:DNA helicase HerA-like ATPase
MNSQYLLKADKSKLGTIISGTSGSGKTTAIISMLRDSILNKNFDENYRFVIIDPKVQPGDYDKLVEPTTDIDSVLSSIFDNRTTLYWPDYSEFNQKQLEIDVSKIVDYLFDLMQENPKMRTTLVIDEASILISSNQISDSLKRLTVQGRAKGIRPIYISQRPLTNRWIDSNISSVVLFRMVPVDADNLTKRWGIDFQKVSEDISSKEYSFVVFDMEKIKTRLVNPVDLPKPIPRKKKDGFFSSLFN